jgi:prophage antirepressor-like protein
MRAAPDFPARSDPTQYPSITQHKNGGDYVSSIIPFTFPETGQPVRTVTLDGEPWFVGRDATAILGYRTTNDGTRWLDEDEKGTHWVRTPGGDQEMVIVSEPGLYSLALRSKLPQAKSFRRWITHEVIPSIRRTGSYSVAPVEMTKLEALQAAIESEQGRLAAEARVAELEPAANSWNVLASGDGDYSVGDAAKILSRDPAIDLGQKRLFTLLAEWRWTYRQLADGRPRVMQAAVETGRLSELPSSHYHPRTGELVLDAPQVRVTAKGLAELHKRLGGTAPVQVPSVLAQGAIGGAL